MHNSKDLPKIKKFVALKHICEITGLTDKWFYQLIKDGKFPKPIKFGRSSRWLASDITDWLNTRITEVRPNIEANKLFTEDDVYAIVVGTA